MKGSEGPGEVGRGRVAMPGFRREGCECVRVVVVVLVGGGGLG